MIFYFVGPDTLRLKEKLEELKDKFKREVDTSGSSISAVEGKNLSLHELDSVFGARSLFSRRQAVVITNASTLKDKKILTAIVDGLKNHDPRGNLIIFIEEKPPAATNALHRWLIGHAHYQQFAALEGKALESWIKSKCDAAGRLIEPKAIRALIDRTEGDSWALAQAMSKLDAYLPAKEPISFAQVELLVVDAREVSLFPLIDAMVAGDVATALPLLERVLSQGETPQSIVGLMELQLRALLALTDATAQKKSVDVGVHPYVLKKLTPLARRYEQHEVSRVYQDLAKLDVDLKTTTIDPRSLLVQFLASRRK